jgi:hypothetical protein
MTDQIKIQKFHGLENEVAIFTGKEFVIVVFQ